MKRSTRFSTAIAATALAAVLLTACAPGTANVSSNTDPVGDPVDGGEIIYVESGVLPSAAPQARTTFQEANIRNSLVDQLVYIDPETKAIRPWLAESWTVNDDATEFTFVLREGVTHSDGTPVDAENVKRNLDTFGLGDLDKGLPKSRYLAGYVGTDVVDARTVTLKVDTSNALVLEALAIPDNGIVANAYLDLSAEEQADFANVIASGPFTVDSYKADEELVLVKRPDYAWSFEGSTNQGAAHLDKVTVRFQLESAARAGLVTSGQADLVRGIAPSDEATITAGGGVVHAAQLGIGAGTQILPRPGHPLLTDVRVRKALQIGYDQEQIVSTVLSDSYIPASSSLNHISFGYKDQSAALAYNPEEAAKLLDEAGWAVGDDGIREKDGKKLSLVVSGSNQGPAIKRVFELVAQQLKEIGVELDISKVGDQAFWVTSQTDPDVALFSVRMPTPDTIYSLGSWSRDYLLLAGSDAELESLLSTALSTLDDTRRAELLGDVQDYLTEQGYSLPLYDEVQVFATSARVQNASFTPTAHPNLQEFWVDDSDN